MRLYEKKYGKGRKRFQQFDFNKVIYKNSYDEINLFENIGRLSKRTLINTWYADERGNKSALMDRISINQGKPLDHYRHNFYNGLLIKSKDWKYEKEYRIIMDNSLGDKISKENRKIKYDFKGLQGIIFGMRTSIQDKINSLTSLNKNAKKKTGKDLIFITLIITQKIKIFNIVLLGGDLMNEIEIFQRLNLANHLYGNLIIFLYFCNGFVFIYINSSLLISPKYKSLFISFSYWNPHSKNHF